MTRTTRANDTYMELWDSKDKQMKKYINIDMHAYLHFVHMPGILESLISHPCLDQTLEEGGGGKGEGS